MYLYCIYKRIHMSIYTLSSSCSGQQFPSCATRPTRAVENCLSCVPLQATGSNLATCPGRMPAAWSKPCTYERKLPHIPTYIHI